MARVLISCVGKSDPWGSPDSAGNPTPGPILSILKHLHSQDQLPDKVLLLVTKTHQHTALLQNGTQAEYPQGGLEHLSNATQQEIKKLYGIAQIVSCELAVNPADLDEVIPEVLKVLQGQIAPHDEVHINISSGTPAMSAALTFLLDSGFLPYQQIWQSLNPTMLPPGAVCVKPVSLGYLTERDRLERAVNLLKAMAFGQAGSAFREISRMSLIPERRPKAQAVASLMEVYQLWDQAEFHTALQRFDSVQQALQRVNLWDKLPHLDDQLSALKRIVNDLNSYRPPRETESILEDIYAALVRRHRSGNYINVTTKARRLYEGILNYLIYQARLDPRKGLERQQSQLEHLNLNKSTLNRIKAIWWKGELRELKEKAAVVDILASDKFTTLKEQYTKFNGARNMSYDEHGLLAVSKPQADRAVSAAANMLHCLGKAREELNDHPFGVRALDELAEAIKKTI
jgi:hypothetical protein